MRLYVVRHAHAGSRSTWKGHDHHRPLSGKGEKEALGIADLLEPRPIRHLLSSPLHRCVLTFEPIAERLGLETKVDRRLAEGGTGEGVLELARELLPDEAAVCTHGDVIPDLLHVLVTTGTTISDPLVWPKGSTWELRFDGDRVVKAKYHPRRE
jgi:broad specificity phosphatase PhoE